MTNLEKLIKQGRELSGKATPRPWRPINYYAHSLDFEIAQIFTRDDNAFVCHACNAHSTILKMLEIAVQTIEKNLEHYCLCTGHTGDCITKEDCDACQSLSKIEKLAAKAMGEK